MIIINSSPVAVTNTASKLRFSQPVEPQPQAATSRESINLGSAQDLRVIKVAPEELEASQLGVRRETVPGQSILQQKPITQYQSNQALLKREEIENILGIDLFV